MTPVKVLTVDDSKVVHMMLANCLEKTRYDVEQLQAANGLEAWEKLQENPDVKLVLCDYTMPVMDGEAFVRKVRKQEKFRYVRIVMVTSVNNKENVTKMLEYGINGYIIKPFDEKKIVQVVENFLERIEMSKLKEG